MKFKENSREWYGKIDNYPALTEVFIKYAGSMFFDSNPVRHEFEQLFTLTDLVSFGNYLLSQERVGSDIHQRSVTDADIENWKYVSSKTISTEESSDLDGSMP